MTTTLSVLLVLCFILVVFFGFLSLLQALEIDRTSEELAQLQSDIKRSELSIETKTNEAIRVWRLQHEPSIREEAIKKSKQVNKGQAYEQLAPFLIADINTKDCSFIGNPIDYIVFDGLQDLHCGKADTLKRVIIVEVKTGSADLTKAQRRIRDAIQDGRVEFAVVRPDKE